MYSLTQISLYYFPFHLKKSMKGITLMLNNQDLQHIRIKTMLAAFFSPFKFTQGPWVKIWAVSMSFLAMVR